MTARFSPRHTTPVGAHSWSWRVNAERIVLFGWGRAILLQLAHPLVAAGVFDHSGFRATPWTSATRLYHTVHAMLSLTFGTDEERERTIDRIRAIHRRVNGVLPHRVGPLPAGTPYSAEDPALVLWVHGTLVESVILAYQRLVGPLSAAARDAYCVEASALAVALAAREHDVPRTWAQLGDYLEGVHASGTLHVGPQARDLARAVLYPARAWVVAPGLWANRIVTIGLLPPSIRERYEMEWTATHQRTFDRLVPTLRTARRMLPETLALWPEARVSTPNE